MPALAAVPESYRHYAKQAVPCARLEAAGAAFKFYHLEKPGEPVPPALAAEARALVARRAGEGDFAAGDRGFVILHRCGVDFHFLLVSVWRGANECWEAVWHHQGDMAGFACFDPAYPAGGGAAMTPRPTFCVWELAIVAHEARAWTRLLTSPRGEEDIVRWRDDLLEGEVL